MPKGDTYPTSWSGSLSAPGGWLGYYVWPDKQAGRNEDAQQLVDALVQALEAGAEDLGRATLRRIISVCRARGFVVR